MKFGNLIMNTTGMRNIGDDVQILAIEHLYDYMGIKQEQRVRIPLTELANWGSEYVVLPIPFCLTSYNNLGMYHIQSKQKSRLFKTLICSECDTAGLYQVA